MFVRLALALALAAVVVTVLVRPSTGAGRERTYVVRPADTLWSIAVASYAGDPREGIWKLQRRNQLRGTLLRPGEMLVLPP
jgi:LysM repeat protein